MVAVAVTIPPPDVALVVAAPSITYVATSVDGWARTVTVYRGTVLSRYASPGRAMTTPALQAFLIPETW